MSATASPHPLKPHISPNIFLHVPANLSQPSYSTGTDNRTETRTRTRTRTKTPPRIIFFVTGNPGLIAYYHAFLSLLSTADPTRECVIAGFSLGGFEIDSHDHDRHDDSGGGGGGGGAVRERDDSAAALGHPGLEALQFPIPDGIPDGAPLGIPDASPGGSPSGAKIYGLEAQIGLMERRVWALVRRVYEQEFEFGDGVEERNTNSDSNSKSGDESKTQLEVEVILLGHSVGAYIVLELIRRHAQQRQQRQRKVNFDIRGAILLTPTIVDIAQSASGRVLTPLVTYVPGFAALVAATAQGLVGVLGRRWLRALVGRITGMVDRDGEGGAMSPLDATVAFLRSARGVRQALVMAGEEMRMIGEDAWGEEVWGVGIEAEAVARAAVRATGTDGGDGRGAVDGDVLVGGRREKSRPPKLVFYFAKTDHWVADETREELLRVRGRLEGKGEDWRLKMVVDEEAGLAHGWCIGQSELVAGKVGKWIGEILGDCEAAK